MLYRAKFSDAESKVFELTFEADTDDNAVHYVCSLEKNGVRLVYFYRLGEEFNQNCTLYAVNFQEIDVTAIFTSSNDDTAIALSDGWEKEFGIPLDLMEVSKIDGLDHQYGFVRYVY